MVISETKSGQLIFLDNYECISYSPECYQVITSSLAVDYTGRLSCPPYLQFQSLNDLKQIIDKEFYGNH